MLHQTRRTATILALWTSTANAVLWIDDDTRWTQMGSPYTFTEDVVVLSGATLTIDPGARILMGRLDPADRGVMPGPSLVIHGALVAQGAPGLPLRFEGLDGSTDDWGGIHFSPSAEGARFDVDDRYLSGSIIRHAEIRHAGGSALFGESVAPYIEAVHFESNAALYDKGEEIVVDPQQLPDEVVMGGAIYLYRLLDRVRIVDSVFSDNRSIHVGGALAIAEAEGIEVEIVGCEFRANEAVAKGGGAVRLLGASPLFEDCLFAANLAERGGAMHASYGAHFETTDCLFHDNFAITAGGALFIAHRSDPSIRRSSFESNELDFAAPMGGGAIAVHGNGSPVIAQSFFGANRAPRGAAIAFTHRNDAGKRPAIVACNRFVENLALVAGEAALLHASDRQDLIVRGNDMDAADGPGPTVVASSGEFGGGNDVTLDLTRNFWGSGGSRQQVELRAVEPHALPALTLGRDLAGRPACSRGL